MASNQGEDSTHNIFASDPLHFKSLVNNLVEVETVNGPVHYKGILYTVDPVTETVVLLNKTDNSLKVTLIKGYNVKEIKSLQSSNVPKIPDNLFKEDWAKHMTETEIEEKRITLKDWLVKNTIPIVESGKILKLDDVLTIEPPYGPEQCLSSNEIVLTKIQDLIKSMPTATVLTKEEEEKRLKVKEWLVKNSVPITESGKILKLDDVLTIEPPYGVEQCKSNNEDVLNKIRDLIKSIPA